MTILFVMLTSLALATLAAYLVIRRSSSPKAALTTSVWWDALHADQIPSGQVAYLAVTLKDDEGVMEGVLATFTWQSDANHRRDIVLKSPIRYHAGIGADGKVQYRKPGYDRVMIDGETIKEIALKYVPR